MDDLVQLPLEPLILFVHLLTRESRVHTLDAGDYIAAKEGLFDAGLHTFHVYRGKRLHEIGTVFEGEVFRVGCTAPVFGHLDHVAAKWSEGTYCILEVADDMTY